MTRITSGIYKGRVLSTPRGGETRPTSEKLRASVFNICQGAIEDAHFLDLFAGSGAMGIEALSRGAKRATFIDHSHSAVVTIRKNLETLEIKEETLVLESDALKALSLYQGPPFDILYIDPPYEAAPPLLTDLLQLLDRKQTLLSPNAWIFVEESLHNPSKLGSATFQNFLLKSTRKVGTTQLLHFVMGKVEVIT